MKKSIPSALVAGFEPRPEDELQAQPEQQRGRPEHRRHNPHSPRKPRSARGRRPGRREREARKAS